MGSETVAWRYRLSSWRPDVWKYAPDKPEVVDDWPECTWTIEPLARATTTLSAQEEQIERLRELLMEARNSADVGLDLNCRIDAALEGSKRDG